MKKKLLFVTALISGTVFGQSFTSSNEPASGTTQQMYQCDSSASSLSATVGSGVTWDYSNIMKMANPNKIYGVEANTNLTDFPLSNKVITIPGALTTYLETSATDRNILGFEFNAGATLGNIKVKFDTDKIISMVYPFALNDALNDAMSGTVTYSGGTSACSGTATSTVDGMGTLKLSPTVTKTNVIRHHSKSILNTTVLIFAFEITIDQFEYYDFVSNLPLFSYTNITIKQGGATVSSLNFVLNTELPTSTASLEENAMSSLGMYPNPAQNFIHFGASVENTALQVSDLSGKVLLTGTTAGPLNVSSLAAGMYTVTYEYKGQLVQEKFMKN